MISRWTRVCALGAVATGLAGCGDAAVDGRWPGEPLYTITGWVELESATTSAIDDTQRASGELRVGIFWAPTKGIDFQLETAVEQDVSTAGTFPARFTVTLYEPPPDALLHPVIDGSGELAQALLLAYLDQDGDGAWDRASEPLIGGASQRLLLYTPGGIVSDSFGQLGPGFHRVTPSGDCGGGVARFAVDKTADVELAVSMSFPASAMLDLDCDGKTDEWTGICPPPSQVRAQCREAFVDPTMCATCEPTLWSVGSDADKCDAWFQGCIVTQPPADCESEWHVCRGDTTTTTPGCTDLACTCKSYHQACLDQGYGEEICGPKYTSCMGT